ncbi:MAG TPA: DUF4349 domain-containing protein [Streptosporangiaceae bacterium]|jgi:hypothetical protein
MGDTNVVSKRGTRVPRRALAVTASVLAALLLASACAGSTANNASSPAMRGAPEKADRNGAAANQPGGPPAKLLPENRAIVYTADMTVRAAKVDDAIARAKSIATGAGGYVADETTTEATPNGGQAVSMLVLKVPVAKYQPTVDRIGRELGRRVSLHQTSEDKTTEVQDVDSRVTSAQTSLRRLRKIMDKATTVSDVMSVEREITSRESDLESLQAQAKALDRQTTYSTVDLRIVGPHAVVHRKTAAAPGFWDGLTAGWHALVAFLRVTVMVVGAVLPFAALAAVIAVPAWWFWRRRRGGGGSPPAEPEPAP